MQIPQVRPATPGLESAGCRGVFRQILCSPKTDITFDREQNRLYVQLHPNQDRTEVPSEIDVHVQLDAALFFR